MNIKKVVIVGAGYMAAEHAKAFSSIPEFRIVGFCSRTWEKARSLALEYNTEAYASIEEAYQKTRADLVIVTVNELSMLEVCKEIFKYPWLCFLEKPVGYNYEQACEIVHLAFEMDHKPFVALNRRSYSSTRSALNYLEEDGGPRLVSVLDQQDMLSARQTGTPELVVTNYMYANSIHLIDYFNVFCRGSIQTLVPLTPWNPDKPANVIAHLQYDSGDAGLYQAIWDGPGPWSVSITNTQYRLEMRPLESLKLQKKGERKMQDIAQEDIDIHYKPGLYYQAQQILNYFNGQVFNLASLNDATLSMQLCSRIYKID